MSVVQSCHPVIAMFGLIPSKIHIDHLQTMLLSNQDDTQKIMGNPAMIPGKQMAFHRPPDFFSRKIRTAKIPRVFHVLAQLQPASTRGPRLLPAPRPEVTAGRPLDAFFYVTPSFPWQWNEIILNVPTYSIIVSPMSPKKRNCAELCGTKSSRLFTCGTPVIWPSAIPG